eukprot:GILJ01006014.1.p1 GENE.GILJ01006014.1~~GILJ01006014.1.p1  ORF type:complete len:972 (-),score=126.57 GILJ01006014.1:378-3293(-)
MWFSQDAAFGNHLVYRSSQAMPHSVVHLFSNEQLKAVLNGKESLPPNQKPILILPERSGQVDHSPEYCLKHCTEWTGIVFADGKSIGRLLQPTLHQVGVNSKSVFDFLVPRPANLTGAELALPSSPLLTNNNGTDLSQYEIYVLDYDKWVPGKCTKTIKSCTEQHPLRIAVDEEFVKTAYRLSVYGCAHGRSFVLYDQYAFYGNDAAEKMQLEEYKAKMRTRYLNGSLSSPPSSSSILVDFGAGSDPFAALFEVVSAQESKRDFAALTKWLVGFAVRRDGADSCLVVAPRPSLLSSASSLLESAQHYADLKDRSRGKADHIADRNAETAYQELLALEAEQAKQKAARKRKLLKKKIRKHSKHQEEMKEEEEVPIKIPVVMAPSSRGENDNETVHQHDDSVEEPLVVENGKATTREEIQLERIESESSELERVIEEMTFQRAERSQSLSMQFQREQSDDENGCTSLALVDTDTENNDDTTQEQTEEDLVLDCEIVLDEQDMALLLAENGVDLENGDLSKDDITIEASDNGIDIFITTRQSALAQLPVLEPSPLVSDLSEAENGSSNITSAVAAAAAGALPSSSVTTNEQTKPSTAKALRSRNAGDVHQALHDCATATLKQSGCLPVYVTVPGVELRGPAPWTNIERMLMSTTPVVTLAHQPRAGTFSSVDDLKSRHLCFTVQDLWDSLREASAFGLTVPLIADLPSNNTSSQTRYRPKAYSRSSPNGTITGVYAPTLSACQMFRKECHHTDRCVHSHCACDYPDMDLSASLVYQFFEEEPPHVRPSMSERIKGMNSANSSISQMRLCEIAPNSWFALLWSPVYRIPNGGLDGSFLVYYRFVPDLNTTCQHTQQQLVAPTSAPRELVHPSVQAQQFLHMPMIASVTSDSEHSSVVRETFSLQPHTPLSFPLPIIGIMPYKVVEKSWCHMLGDTPGSTEHYSLNLMKNLKQSAMSFSRSCGVAHSDFDFFARQR